MQGHYKKYFKYLAGIFPDARMDRQQVRKVGS
jgi:hypothetical protein